VGRGIYGLIWGVNKRGIFWREGLDHPNRADMSGKFRFSAQRFELAPILNRPSFRGVRSTNYDVQLHIGESIGPQAGLGNGFRVRATRAPE
jgi:hypothetical protein